MKLITTIAIVIACSQLLLFIGPFFLFGELAMAAQRRAGR